MIITRSRWVARGTSPQISTPVSKLVLHHSVTPEWLGVDAARSLDSIARRRGFVQISYNWLVDVQGNQIEGRGWGRLGAHTQGYNSTAHAICLIGNFQTNQPPQAMLEALADLVRVHGKKGFGPGRITHGHRQLGQTSCPGQKAFDKIALINRMAQGDAGPPQDDKEGLPVWDESKEGSSSNAKAQEWLNTLGYDSGEVDGKMGPNTKAAIRKFENEHWLKNSFEGANEAEKARRYVQTMSQITSCLQDQRQGFKHSPEHNRS